MEKKVVSRVEVLGDYDGILYHQYEDGSMLNIHCNVEFDKGLQIEDYGPLYQFKDGELVAFSRHKAKGLNEEDDLSEDRNLLWGTRGIDGKQDLVFKPIKDLSVSHIKNIISENHTNNKRYLRAFTDVLSSIITIKK